MSHVWSKKSTEMEEQYEARLVIVLGVVRFLLFVGMMSLQPQVIREIFWRCYHGAKKGTRKPQVCLVRKLPEIIK